MAQFLGNLHQYDPADSTLSSWFQLFDEYCNINEIEAEPQVARGAVPPHNRRRALFLSSVGPRAYEVLRQACLPARPNASSISVLREILRDRFEPAGLKSTNRFQFSQRNQKDGETITEYIHTLQNLASLCNFGLFLNDALKDRLISGVKSDHLRRQLLGVADLTWAGAKDMALQEESVRLQAKAIASASVNKVTAKKPWRKQEKTQAPAPNQDSKQQSKDSKSKWGPCYRCGDRHNANTCKVRSWECRSCGKVGHMAKVCRKKRQQKVNQVQDQSVPTQTVDQEALNLVNALGF